MTPQNYNDQNLVLNMRKIRDDISNEIKEMTFEQERAYLDALLSSKHNQAPNSALAIAGLDEEQ